MSWNDLTLNPKILLGYFDHVPSLDGIEIQSISLQPMGPCMEIVFEPAKFPERPSARWHAGSNRCQITLRAIGVTGLEISGWDSQVGGNLAVTQSSQGISLLFEEQTRFRVSCDFIDIANVADYINSQE